MQWWCSAQGGAWTWTWQPFPGVWAFVLLLGAGYWWLYRRSETRAASEGRRKLSAAAGVLALWVALGWPIGPLGAGYLASAHMVQFLLIAIVAPPLLLRGVPRTAWQRLRRHATVVRGLRSLTHPLLTLGLFNVIVIGTHVPIVVDTLVATQLGMLTLDMLWLLGGLLFWWPIVAPVPERPGVREIVKVGYLGAQMILNTPLFFWLTFSKYPYYATYELAPRVPGLALTALQDQVTAGCIMKIVGGLIYLGVVGVLFYRWSQREDERRLPSTGRRRDSMPMPTGV